MATDGVEEREGRAAQRDHWIEESCLENPVLPEEPPANPQSDTSERRLRRQPNGEVAVVGLDVFEICLACGRVQEAVLLRVRRGQPSDANEVDVHEVMPRRIRGNASDTGTMSVVCTDRSERMRVCRLLGASGASRENAGPGDQLGQRLWPAAYAARVLLDRVSGKCAA